jgi:gas vesicle protein
MSDKSDNFFGGFILGAIAGGVVGALIASKLNDSAKQSDLETDRILDDEDSLLDREPVDLARRGLEQKIAQLNAAIDAVSNELSTSTGNGRKKSTIGTNSNSDREDESS